MHVPDLLVQWVKIRLSKCMDCQWKYTLELSFPDLALLCEGLYNQEVWDTTFPPGFSVESRDLSQVHVIEVAPSTLYNKPPSAPHLAAATNFTNPANMASPAAPLHQSNRLTEALEAPPNFRVVNERHVAVRWAAIRDRCDKLMRFVFKKAEEAGVPVPLYTVGPRINCCPT